ncbi:MAG: hypothetical protein ACOYOV_17130, partial [Bacteroidales bacterium]
MKKIFILSFLSIAFWLSNSNSYAQRSYEMQLLNLVQVNETELRFDIRVKNTAVDPVTNFIAVEGMQFQVAFNTAMLNGGGLNKTYLTVVPSTTDIVAPVGQSSPITPSNSGVTTDQTKIQWLSSPLAEGAYTIMIDHNNWVRVGTFKLILKATSASANSKNFASVIPSLTLVPSGCLLNWCDVDFDMFGDGGYTRQAAAAPNLITSKLLTNTDASLTKPLYSHAYTGTGNFSVAANWNTTVAATDASYHIVPTVATNSISIGKYTTATVPLATPGVCTMDVDKQVNSLYISTPTSTLTVNAGKKLTVDGLLVKNNTAATALTLKSDAAGTASLLNNTAGITATIERYIPAWTTNEGYHLLSSPVSGQLIAPNFVTTPATNYDFYLYNPAAAPNVWINYKGTNFSTMNGGLSFVTGKGYLASYAAAATHNFAGTMNVGNVAPTLAPAAGFNLVGNPYACAIQGNISTFSPTGMNASVWVLDGTTNSYKAWNGVTGIPITFNGEIPAMQGFFVNATSAGASITIPASAKKHSSSNFYKTTLDNLLELNVQSPNNTKDATVIYFKDENSNDVDNYDAMLMPSANPLNTQIYSYINNDKYCIDALAAYSGPYTVN